MPIKEQHKEPCGDGTVLYLDCTDVNILVLILDYSFTQCSHYVKMGKSDCGICFIFYNCM